MDTIRVHAKKLKAPFKDNYESTLLIEGVKDLAKSVVHNDKLSKKVKINILKFFQCIISEAHGKHSTRFRSKLVLDLATYNPMNDTKIIHEHVFTRAHISKQILEYPDKINDLLDSVVACIVTKEEHSRLTAVGSVEGWSRYSHANPPVHVVDMCAQ